LENCTGRAKLAKKWKMAEKVGKWGRLIKNGKIGKGLKIAQK